MKILIVENDCYLAESLTRLLHHMGHSTDDIPDGGLGWELAKGNGYNLMILDFDIPGMSSLEMCHQSQANHSLLSILTLGPNRIEDKVASLDTGSDDYLSKPFEIEELAARIRALLRRSSWTRREPLLEYGDIKLDPVGGIAWQGQRCLNLTRIEMNLLEYLMHRPGEIVSHEELLNHAWDIKADVSLQTVRVHIHWLRRKLGDDHQKRHYIQTIAGRGYRLLPSPSLE